MQIDNEEKISSSQIHKSIFFVVSILLALLFNPQFLIQNLLQAGGQCIAVFRWLRQKQPKLIESIRFNFPLEGIWEVYNGGLERDTSHSWSLVAQRFAYDFVIRDPSTKRTYKGLSSELSSYLAFNQPVFAPADGTVVKIRRNIHDYCHPNSGLIDWQTKDIRGNYLVIDHGSVFSLLAHLKEDSICVQVGEKVVAGDVVARVGNSGVTTEPHLHFQVMDTSNFYTAISLPIQFRAVITVSNGMVNLQDGIARPGNQLQSTTESSYPSISVLMSIGIWEFIYAVLSLLLTLSGVVWFWGKAIKLLISFITGTK